MVLNFLQIFDRLLKNILRVHDKLLDLSIVDVVPGPLDGLILVPALTEYLALVDGGAMVLFAEALYPLYEVELGRPRQVENDVELLVAQKFSDDF